MRDPVSIRFEEVPRIAAQLACCPSHSCAHTHAHDTHTHAPTGTCINIYTQKDSSKKFCFSCSRLQPKTLSTVDKCSTTEYILGQHIHFPGLDHTYGWTSISHNSSRSQQQDFTQVHSAAETWPPSGTTPSAAQPSQSKDRKDLDETKKRPSVETLKGIPGAWSRGATNAGSTSLSTGMTGPSQQRWTSRKVWPISVANCMPSSLFWIWGGKKLRQSRQSVSDVPTLCPPCRTSHSATWPVYLYLLMSSSEFNYECPFLYPAPVYTPLWCTTLVSLSLN